LTVHEGATCGPFSSASAKGAGKARFHARPEKTGAGQSRLAPAIGKQCLQAAKEVYESHRTGTKQDKKIS